MIRSFLEFAYASFSERPHFRTSENSKSFRFGQFTFRLCLLPSPKKENTSKLWDVREMVASPSWNGQFLQYSERIMGFFNWFNSLNLSFNLSCLNSSSHFIFKLKSMISLGIFKSLTVSSLHSVPSLTVFRAGQFNLFLYYK